MKDLMRFYYAESDTIVLNGIDKIGSSAFENEKTLKCVEYTSSLKDVCSKAFAYSNLERFILNSSEESEYKALEVVELDSSNNGNSESSVSQVPQKLCIQYRAFKGCEKLSTIELCADNIEIEAEAFAGCFNLQNVIIISSDSGNVSISENAFDGVRNVVFVSKNSAVQRFAREHEYKFFEGK